MNPSRGRADQDAATAVLTELEDEWARALVSNDAVRIATFMADDWVLVSGSGITTREQFLSHIAEGRLVHTAMSPQPPSHVRVDGDTAVLAGRVTSSARWEEHGFDADEWQTDVFVRTDWGWRCVLTHLTAAESQ